jgi:hypothetical protein
VPFLSIIKQDFWLSSFFVFTAHLFCVNKSRPMLVQLSDPPLAHPAKTTIETFPMDHHRHLAVMRRFCKTVSILTTAKLVDAVIREGLTTANIRARR